MNGLLVVDKPGGMTSHDVVNRLRQIAGERSIGHLGTLDPLATGVLPLMIGKYTRLAQYFASAEKTYTGTIRFGFSTDTYDAAGEPAGPDLFPGLLSDPVSDLLPDLRLPTEGSLTLERVRAAAARFDGVMEQMPPPYSAKKIAGTPAYKLARQGKPVELKPAKINILSFEILHLEGAVAGFTIAISAGGYVRSVAHELGQALGIGAHLSGLRRTRAGAFTLDQAHTLEELQSVAGNAAALEGLCVHPRNLLPQMPAVTADTHALARLRNGAQANLPEFSSASLVKVFAGQREMVGIARRIAGTLFQPVVVMG